MKILLTLPCLLLASCASMKTSDDPQVARQCAIGYHKQYSSYLTIKSTEEAEKQPQDKSKFSEDVRCVADSDQDKFLNQHY